MNAIKRAVRSVQKRYMRSFFLLAVIAVISTLLTAGMAGRTANVQIQDHTRNAVGASFLLVENEADRKQRINDIIEKNQIEDGFEGTIDGVTFKSIGNGSSFIGTENSFETLLWEDIQQIASVEGVKDYNVTTSPTLVNPVNFERIEDSDKDQNLDPGCVNVIGELNMELDSYIQNGYLELTQGQWIRENQENVCVISEELAKKNGLKVGDILSMNNYREKESAKVYDAEIIGIYKITQTITPYMSGDSYRTENMIFTDLHFPEKAEGEEGNPLFDKAMFRVENVDEYETVKQEILDLPIRWERYDFIDQNGNLETMAQNFNDLEKISSTLLIAVAAASLMILCLIFLFWMKNRTREIGIYLAIGISKTEILTQILLETLLIGAAAFLISMAAAPAVTQGMTYYLAAEQEKEAMEEKEAQKNSVATEYPEQNQTISGVQTSVTGKIIAVDAAAITVLLFVSVMTAGISVMRRKPKEILSEMS